MKNTISYKGYLGSVECSEEDQTFFGKVLFIKSLLLYEGETYKEFVEQFHEAVDGYLADCEEAGVQPEKSCSGSFNVRVGHDRHFRLSEYAYTNGMTINSVVCSAVDYYFEQNAQIAADQDSEINKTSFDFQTQAEGSLPWTTNTAIGNA